MDLPERRPEILGAGFSHLLPISAIPEIVCQTGHGRQICMVLPQAPLTTKGPSLAAAAPESLNLGQGPKPCSRGAERETETTLNHFPSPCLYFFPTLLRGACKLCVAAEPSRRHTWTAKHNTALIRKAGGGQGSTAIMPILITVTRAAVPSPP